MQWGRGKADVPLFSGRAIAMKERCAGVEKFPQDGDGRHRAWRMMGRAVFFHRHGATDAMGAQRI